MGHRDQETRRQSGSHEHHMPPDLVISFEPPTLLSSCLPPETNAYAQLPLAERARNLREPIQVADRAVRVQLHVRDRPASRRWILEVGRVGDVERLEADLQIRAARQIELA